ncbi:hypothetical protein [Virgisporangium aurantiacum]|uniref:Uncharacterized protein n=1 Tax=Virgisporangium aurantiacum TaxID=175570 RepID=A0A8J3ZDX6_9ACTN|nr:hypothetical protein [Virgisporangium aurantiacum]GIJ61023.1 hypothetical protein Vau01_085390 [Virgisporangium aurantiacum]
MAHDEPEAADKRGPGPRPRLSERLREIFGTGSRTGGSVTGGAASVGGTDTGAGDMSGDPDASR